MVTTIKGIDLGTTGIRESSVKTRERIEQSQENIVNKITREAKERLKKVTETKTGKPNFISFPISKFLEEYGFSSEDKVIKTRLAYNLRQSENIVTQLGEADNRVVPDNMKPFAYSYVTPEVKQNMGLNAYCMKNLSEEMKEYIQQKAQKVNAKSDIYDLLLICDYLTAHDAHKKWYKLMGLKLSADLGQPIVRTKEALEDLISAHVLLTGQIKRKTRGKDTICHLAYNVKDFSVLNNQLLSGEAEDAYKGEHSSDAVASASLIERNIETISEDTCSPQIWDIAKDIQNNLNEHKGLSSQKFLTDESSSDILEKSDCKIKSYDDLTKEDAALITQLILRMKKPKLSVEVEEQKKNSALIKQLRDLLTASQDENNQLRKDNLKAESEINRLKHQLKIQEDFNQAYAAEARKSMNQLISSTSSVVEKYTKIPPKRVTADDTAEFKNEIISAAMDAQNRLRDFTYSNLVENLKK